MNYGFVKVAAATPKIKVADCEYNKNEIIKEITAAYEKGVKLAAFPELCITGYTCSDLFLQDSLLDGAKSALIDIVNATADMEIISVVGLPLALDKLYNCAAVICRGEILGIIPKTHIPNYSEFYEARHFSSGKDVEVYDYKIGEFDGIYFGTNVVFRHKDMADFSFAVEICEDLWVPNMPSVSHAAAGANIIVNLSASNEVIGKPQYRHDLVCGQSARLMCGYIYATAGDGESTTDMVFSGHNIIAENGTVLAEAKLFQNEMTTTEIDVKRLSHERRRMTTYGFDMSGYNYIEFSQKTCETELTRSINPSPFVPSDEKLRSDRCETIITMQSVGLKKRLEHIGCKTAVIGISGGLDSCLALIVAVRAMDMLSRPRTDIIAVTMPCFGTTSRTKSNAQKLCEQLGVSFREVDITPAVKQHFKDIGQDAKKYDVTYENSQARERTQVIMDIANMTGGIVIGTGDLSELALGWATYNGDHMSMYAVNASIPKTLVRYLVRHYAESCGDGALKTTLMDIYDTPVSPELIPGAGDDIAQKTEDIVGPYELHDFFLYNMLRFGFSPRKIYHLAKSAFRGTYENAVILKWLKNFIRRFFAQQFKRSCLPDGPKVGTIAVSPRADWRMPSDASAALWLAEADELSE